MSDLPVVGDAGAATGEARVHGVLLAAGTSDRFGGANKLLAPVDGEPMVALAARTLADADLAGVTVVVGHEASAVEAAVADLPVEVARNEAYRDGQASSVGVGVRAARAAGADAVVVALGDMPDVSPGTVRTLVAAYENGAGTALAAACDGERGNPVLFDRHHFDDLLAVEGDVGGRTVLLSADRAALVETGDPGVRRDVDTRSDYERR